MSVFVINPLTDPRWNALVQSHPQASVFHSTAWLRALEQSYGYTCEALTTAKPGEPLTDGLPQEHCYVNVLRDAMAVDTLPECGIYFGTTGGQVYASADSGDSWAPIVRDLPAVLSVEVQTLP